MDIGTPGERNRPYHSRSLIRPDRVETLAAAISRQPARGCAPGGEEHIYVSWCV